MPIQMPVTETTDWRISYVSDGSSNTTITGLLPTGVVNGDFLLAIAANNASVNPLSIAHPAGWIDAGYSSYLDGNFTVGLRIGYRIASSEPASYDWGVSTSVLDDAVTILRFRGVHATPFVATGVSSAGSSISPDNAGITTTVDGATALWIVAAKNGTNLSAENSNYPSGTTGLYVRRSRNNSSGINVGLAYETITTAGATGPRTWTNLLTTARYYGGFSIALQPAAGGSTEFLRRSFYHSQD